MRSGTNDQNGTKKNTYARKTRENTWLAPAIKRNSTKRQEQPGDAINTAPLSTKHKQSKKTLNLHQTYQNKLYASSKNLRKNTESTTHFYTPRSQTNTTRHKNYTTYITFTQVADPWSEKAPWNRGLGIMGWKE